MREKVMNDYRRVVEKDIDVFIKEHRSMFGFEPEQVKALKSVMECTLDPGKPHAVGDVCCGLGQISYHLKDFMGRSRFTGIDISPEQIEEACRIFDGFGLSDRFEFRVGDIYDLEEFRDAFDVTLCWQTLFVLDGYEKPVKELIKATRSGGHIYIISLFNEHDVDIHADIIDYTRPSGRSGLAVKYSTYSVRRFEDFCRSAGIKSFDAHDFIIGIDLPMPSHGGIGTYTLKLDNGNRIQVSGGHLMNWKIVHLAL